ncbi:MAG: AAA family ATPase [Fimbriimonadaceae bacterium]
MDAIREVEILFRAKYPILQIVSWEEGRVLRELEDLCRRLDRTLHVWSLTQGLKPPLKRGGPSSGPSLPGELEVLAQVHEAPEFTVFVLKDFHPFLKDHRVVRLLRDLASRLRGRAQTVVILSPIVSIPNELQKDLTVVDYGLPSPEEIGRVLDQAIAAVKDNPQIDATVTPEDRERLIHSAQGLTLDEVESVLARSLVAKRRFDVDEVLEEKKQIVRKSGLLEYYPATDTLDDVGGMESLKEWLQRRKDSFTDRAREFGIPAPKGVLLLGVQGCGKSLVAKAIAAAWGLPMLKLDVGRIFGSLVGQSEENIRRAIAVAESVAPCILWADELEKGFSGLGGSGVSDGGTTARVFATFLTWMQEKTKPVFLIATANDVSALPPEMLRKGRFDEIFFVDLPSRQEREEIFAIHLRRRRRDPAAFDLKALARATEGFSGAEIEQVVVGALYTAFGVHRELEQKDLLAEAKAAVPLSVMMAEEIDELRTWASLRTRPASRRAAEPSRPRRGAGTA